MWITFAADAPTAWPGAVYASPDATNGFPVWATASPDANNRRPIARTTMPDATNNDADAPIDQTAAPTGCTNALYGLPPAKTSAPAPSNGHRITVTARAATLIRIPATLYARSATLTTLSAMVYAHSSQVTSVFPTLSTFFPTDHSAADRVEVFPDEGFPHSGRQRTRMATLYALPDALYALSEHLEFFPDAVKVFPVTRAVLPDTHAALSAAGTTMMAAR